MYPFSLNNMLKLACEEITKNTIGLLQLPIETSLESKGFSQKLDKNLTNDSLAGGKTDSSSFFEFCQSLIDLLYRKEYSPLAFLSKLPSS